MRFHVLGLPHTVTSKEFNACAYTQKVVKFGKMMTQRGHTVIHYGHEDSDLTCTEHVPVIKNEDWTIAYGSHNWKENFFRHDTGDHAYQTFYKNAIEEVGKRKQKNDFILPFWGSGVRPICDAHPDLITVEPGIGYAGGHWAKWKVFESYAIYHAYCGLKNVGSCNQDWYETVIPNYFDLDDFEFQEKKDDYFLYLGRVYNGKGVHIAIQACERAGVKLVIAGQKEDGYTFPSNVEYVGYADSEKRKQLMKNAKASFLPSMYVEPFGGVQIENLLSGTPTITTDWGCFAENNLHGVTGYRCRTIGDFVQAIKNIDKINPRDCRTWGENFSLEKVAPMYEKYFNDVLNVYTGNGWYESAPSNVLDALEKKYPSFKVDCDSPVVDKKPQRSNKLTQKKKNNRVVFFIEPEWAYGRIHYDLLKILYSRGIDCHLLPWNKSYTLDEMKEQIECVDTFVTTPHGWKSLRTYGIKEEKCVIVAHSKGDLEELVVPEGTRSFNKFKKFACVSKWLSKVSNELGIEREPEALNLGINYNNFYCEPSDSLKVVGFGGGYIENENASPDRNGRIKRGWLVKKAAEMENLSFKVAIKYHSSFITMPGFYKNIDVLVCASTEEGAGLPILEAAAAGRLIITTNVGHVPELVKDVGAHIVKTEENDFIAEVTSILRFYKENEEEYRKKCHQIQEHAKRYDWNNCIEGWIELLS